MRLWTPASVLCLALVGGAALQSATWATRPDESTPRLVTFEEAEMLVLVTKPVLEDFAHGTPVLSWPRGVAIAAGGGYYSVEVSTVGGEALGFYKVDRRTARVFTSSGRELRGPQLDAAQRIVREDSGIAIAAPVAMRR